VARDALVQNLQLPIIGQQFFNALSPNFPRNGKRKSGSEQVADEYEKKTPPKPKEEAAAHAEDAPG
jgi:hypothetical protein